ncbi:MAG: hypothetical protein R2879_02985 [Saprospiraceae bacterium]
MRRLPIRYFLSLTFAIFIANFSFGQLKSIPGKAVYDYANAQELNEQFNHFNVYQIDQTSFKSFIRKSGENIQFEFELGNQYEWTVGDSE